MVLKRSIRLSNQKQDNHLPKFQSQDKVRKMIYSVFIIIELIYINTYQIEMGFYKIYNINAFKKEKLYKQYTYKQNLFLKNRKNYKKIMNQHKEIMQQHIHEKQHYQFYRPQQKNQDGTFNMRFQQILNSTINKWAGQQLWQASRFQLVKTMKTMKSYAWNLLTSKNKNKIPSVQKQIDLKAKEDEIKMTWLGHASVFISIKNKINILIDPIFQDRIVQYVGEPRQVDSIFKVQGLPPIDYVFISHDHYDHCNIPTLQKIQKKFRANDVNFIIGRESKNLLSFVQNKNQSDRIHQMSWTKSNQFTKRNEKIKVTFVPACHWSKRSLNDQNNRLWGGYVIETCGKKIYFAGDTGDCGLFKQLGQVFGGFDLSLLPIGAYQPNKFLKAQHINPEQAVRIHTQIKSKLTVGIHWGTFRMSHQTPQKVLEDLNEARKNYQISQQVFKTVNIGGSVVLDCSNKYIY